jgi:hypothetical protein
MSTRRVYSETLPYEELVRPRTLGLLARYELELVLAVRPWDLAKLPRVAKALGDIGVSLSIWPMLSDEQGRWANMHNASSFADLTLSACDVLVANGVPPRDVLFDLEPPFAQTRSLAEVGASHSHNPVEHAGIVARFATRLSRSAQGEFDTAGDVLARTVVEVHARDITTSMAVWPLVALDPPGADTWQSLLGTPVDALHTGHISVMMYTSILEGWSRGALRRRDARALLGAATARAVRRWGASAGISLGCVGVGALEDEPTYRHPSELAEDARMARAAGCDRLALFDLGGVLSRPPAEAWLDAFVSADPVAVGRDKTSKRVQIARTVARAATWTLGRVQSISRQSTDSAEAKAVKP